MVFNVVIVEKLGYKFYERILRLVLVGVFKLWWVIGLDLLWRYFVYLYINI